MKFHHFARRQHARAGGLHQAHDMAPVKLGGPQQQAAVAAAATAAGAASPTTAALVANQLNQHLLSMHLAQQQQHFHQLEQNHHQQRQPQNLNLSQQLRQQQQHSDDEGADDEVDEEMIDDDEFVHSANYLNQHHLHNQQQQPQPQQHHQPHQTSSDTNTTNGSSGVNSSAGGGASSNGFLMDKNKKLFPQKLWELIHNPSIQHCLRWSQDGQRVYLNRNEFEQYYLKTANNQFHTQKAISFVRQMNMYGFRKVDDCYYENDNFRRDRKHLLKNMIRRHPNKGLFVGLEHHQLAAAAAAQQALQVNQQLQHLESQHKQRAEQALRLNNYLASHHPHQHPQHAQFAAQSNSFAAAAAAAAAAQQQQQQLQPANGGPLNSSHSSSSPFEQNLSSHLAKVAAGHFSQQQHQQIASLAAQQHQQQHQHLGENLTTSAPSSNATAASNPTNMSSSVSSASSAATASSITAPTTTSGAQFALKAAGAHLPRKSRLLSEFYASTNGASEQSQPLSDEAHKQQQQQQLELYANSGALDLKSSSLSALPTSTATTGDFEHKLTLASRNSQLQQLARESRLAGLSQSSLRALSGGANGPTDFSAAAARQAALHETLVRSLLQLKHSQHSQDLVASLQHHHIQQQQHQQQRTLLESLASLSSAGTGSIVDPASNSPTERTATPPSGPPSPSLGANSYDELAPENDNNNMALNLAKSSSVGGVASKRAPTKQRVGEDEEEFSVNIEVDDARESDRELGGGARDRDDGDNDDDDDEATKSRRDVDQMAGSPLDGTKKVRKFLEDQMARVLYDEKHVHEREHDDEDDNPQVEPVNGRPVKREYGRQDDYQARGKRPKLYEEASTLGVEPLTRMVIERTCAQRPHCQLDEAALAEAVSGQKIELERDHKNCDADDEETITTTIEELNKKVEGEDESAGQASEPSAEENKKIDVSSLSRALKLIPSKLVAALQREPEQIQQQVTDATSDCNNIQLVSVSHR